MRKCASVPLRRGALSVPPAPTCTICPRVGSLGFCAGVGVEHPDVTNASRRIKKSEVEKCAKNGIKEIIEINRQNLWVIGTVGAIPQLFIVKDTFRNVPEVAVGCWPLRTPGATAPESYAIDEG